MHADLETVRRFHRSAESLSAITPPPIAVRDVEAPDTLADGDEMRFRLSLGVFSVPWRARIEDVGPEGFTDRQVEGPFSAWCHRHDFVSVESGVTEVRDTVTFRLSRRPAQAAIGLAMAAGLPALFRYRAWRTRRLLEAGDGR